MRESDLLIAPRRAEVSRVVIELIKRAESYVARCMICEARSAFHAAVVADETPRARLDFAAFLVAQGDFATAELHLRTALDLAHARGRHDERCECCLALASVTAQRGDQVQSTIWLQQAVKWQLADGGELSARVLTQLGLHAVREGKIDEARNLLWRAQAVTGDDERAVLLLHLAVIDHLQDDSQSALRRMSVAFQMFRSEGDQEGCAFALLSSGNVLRDLLRWNESGRCFTQATRIFNELGQSNRAKRAAAFAREVRRIAAAHSQAYLSN